MHFFKRWGVMVLFLASLAIQDATLQAASLRLNWQDQSSNEAGFNIERQSGMNYIRVASVQAGIQTFTDSGLADGASYCYRVRAFNSAGTSSPSNAACATATNTATSSTKAAPTPSPNSSTSPLNTTPQAGKKWGDYRVNVKLRSTDNDSIGVMFRYQDSDNYYRFSWYSQLKYRRLEKRVGGSFKILAQDSATYTSGRTYALQIVAQGASLKVFIDGKSVFSVNDASFAAGTIALYSYYNAGSSFDDITVADLNTGAILLSTNFNDTQHAGWTFIDEGDDGGPSQWSSASGVLVQTRNVGSTVSGALGTYALYTRGSWQDYRITVKMRSTDNDPLGIMFRFQDSDNYYRFSWDRESPGRQLLKRQNGAFKIVAEDTVPYVIGRTYLVEIDVQGSSLRVNIDGSPVFSVNDQSFRIGSVGLFSTTNQGSIFDDILVEDLATHAVLLSDNFNDGTLSGWTIFDEAGTSMGPSKWSVVNGTLVQTSNIGSDALGNAGTFVLY